MPENRYQPPGNAASLQNADWPALQLLNHYRLFLVVSFAAVFYIGDGLNVVGQRDPVLFQYTHLLYLFMALVSAASISLRKPSLETQFYLQSYLDILCLTGVIYASGGINSGLGNLVVVQLAVIGLCMRGRYALLFAAIATATLLSQELYSQSVYPLIDSDLRHTALVCVSLFVVTFLTSILLPGLWLASHDEKRPLTVKQVADLNSQIIKVLESGLLYVDSKNRVQLANTMALELLESTNAPMPMSLKLLSEPLHRALKQWKKEPSSGNRPFTCEANGLELLPGFSRLDNRGTLIKLEDHRIIKQQVQQLKLASLGRLSASIAHEIRNPLGAISNAVQLLGESDQLSQADTRLIDIAENHTRRINRIIEDVMQLSRRQSAKIEAVSMHAQLVDFKTRFTAQNNLPETAITIPESFSDLILFDPVHLDQILWNLCTNSLVHNTDRKIEISISCTYHHVSLLSIDIADNGSGIAEDKHSSIFEPFFTTAPSGTGLGLFIIRELCELNHATIEYVEQSSGEQPCGACFRISLPLAQEMAA